MVAKPLWVPSSGHIKETNVWKFIQAVNHKFNLNIKSFNELWVWSIEAPADFWEMVAAFTHLISTPIQGPLTTDSSHMWEQHFFPEVQLNFAENLLRRMDDLPAIIFWGEERVNRTLSYKDLYHQVIQLATALKANGLQPGDRVAGFVPNTPEALIAMLATVSLGGVWASGSPDFGVDGALDRFGQIEPKFLFASDGYFYNGKEVNILEKVTEISEKLPSLKHTIIYNYISSFPNVNKNGNLISWANFIEAHECISFEFKKFPFNHPLFIMFSSGTTGKPKCIVHGAGGTLLQHMKEHQLHMDIREGDRMFYFTTCGWMMWNWLVSGLASGATLVLFDGSPFARRGRILIDMIDEVGITMFGVSAKYIDAIAKLKLEPKNTHQLNTLRSIGSTGSPLSHESFHYIYNSFKKDVQLVSLSGGTDIISCFALGNPIGSVYPGQLQTRGLGLDVDVVDESGSAVRSTKGELVCKKAFPCMPLYFWDDPKNKRYKSAYFDKFKNIWCHGDYVELTPENGMIFHGRSDAVLNPGGVRIGTAEIYRQVEKVEEVLECFAIGQRWESDERIVLFVKLRDGLLMNKEIKQKIQNVILANTTRRHVPEVIVSVPDIPKTRSGKIVELAVRDIIHGEEIKNIQAISNPEALEFFKHISELKKA
ncbi:MAG: acetoacetate--CoA ligase [Candidatus Paracaedibacteraceae bacterium]|nr:acetoacetate--CoA ligase [Candidatus Paracaedibacteraceae bacterium]